MDGGPARLIGAALTLAGYYWILVLHPFAAPAAEADARLQADIGTSRALFDARKFSEALAPTQRLADQMPTQPVYHGRLALIYHELDRRSEEAQAWERMMAASATPIDACPMVAEARRKAGEMDAALAALEKCASLPPRNADFELMLGQWLLELDRKADARRAFERGLQIDSGYPDLYLLVGVRQFDDGDRVAARRSFEEFLRLAPQRHDEVDIWLERTKGVK